MADRDFILRRIRSAVEGTGEAEHSNAPAAWNEKQPQTYRQADELLHVFQAACAALPADIRTARTNEGVREHLLAVLRKEGVRTYATWRSPSLDEFHIPDCLDSPEFVEVGGLDGSSVKEHGPAAFKTAVAAADAGITGADFGLADTGTLVLTAGRGRERSLSVLPPIHVSVLRATQILESTLDLLSGPLSSWNGSGQRPSSTILITGSSKTGDIEMELVRGVHGPGRLYLIVRA